MENARGRLRNWTKLKIAWKKNIYIIKNELEIETDRKKLCR